MLGLLIALCAAPQEDAAAILERGRRHYAGAGYREALGCFEESLRRGAGAEAHAWAALSLLRLGDVEKFQSRAEAAKAAGLTWDAYQLEEARGWASQARWKEAEGAVEAHLAGHPRDGGGLELKALVLVETERAESALPLLERVARQDATRATTARLLLARARLKLGQFAEARRELQAVAREAEGTLWAREAARRLIELDRAEQAARAAALKAADPEAAEDEKQFPMTSAVDEVARKLNVLRRDLGEAAVPMDRVLADLRARLGPDAPPGRAAAEALAALEAEAQALRGSEPARAFIRGQLESAALLERSAESAKRPRDLARARQIRRLLVPLRDAIWPP
jgi:tetratricopeptide (TPR) repeat protein